MSNYSVIFEGTISDGHKVEDVKRNLAALFKIDDEKADLLFAKQTVVLKKGLDHDSAIRYRQAILKTGAVCNVKEAGQPAGALAAEAAAPVTPAAQALQQSTPPAIPAPSSANATQTTAETHSEASAALAPEKKSVKGTGDIISGIVIIGIGFMFGGSVFLGNPGLLDYFFDGLGVFWIGRGIYKMVR